MYGGDSAPAPLTAEGTGVRYQEAHLRFLGLAAQPGLGVGAPIKLEGWMAPSRGTDWGAGGNSPPPLGMGSVILSLQLGCTPLYESQRAGDPDVSAWCPSLPENLGGGGDSAIRGL